MKKSDLKNCMIVRNGYGELFLLLKNKCDNNYWVIVSSSIDEEYGSCWYDEDDSPIEFEADDFDDYLVNIEDPISSIIEVYEPIPIKFPLVLGVDSLYDLYDKYKPELVWEREPSIVSKSKLESFSSNKEAMEYIDSIVPPYLIVE